jgi:hypothetical protein
LIVNSYCSIDIYFNNQDLKIENDIFNSLIINETLHYSCYYAILNLKNVSGVFKIKSFTTGEKVRISINFKDDTTYDSDFVIFSTNLDKDIFSIVLIPELLQFMKKEKGSVGYKGNVSTVVNQIMTDIKLKFPKVTYDVENTRGNNLASYFKLGQSYFDFLKYLADIAYNKNADYIFFIGSNNKIKFKSMTEICKNTDNVADEFDDTKLMSNPVIDNNTFAYQSISGGNGSTGYAFDWDNGDMKEYVINSGYIQDNFANYLQGVTGKLGIDLNYVDENNNIVMLNSESTGTTLSTEADNKKILENNLIRKNLFNVFVKVTLFGNMKYTPMELVKYYSISPNSDNNIYDSFYTGTYFIYEAIHLITLKGNSTELTMASPFLFDAGGSNIK